MNFFKKWFQREADLPENTPLRQAMLAVAQNDTPDTRRRLYEQLINTQLFLATPDGPEQEETGQLNPDDEISLVLMQNDKGQIAWPVFTDKKALADWRSEGGYIALPGRILFDMMVSTDAHEIILNPASTVRGTITRIEAQILAQEAIPQVHPGGSLSWQINKPTQMLLAAPPSESPQQLIPLLLTELAAHPQIAVAYLFQATLAGSKPNLMVGLRFLGNLDRQTADPILRSIASAARPALAPDQYIDVVVLTDPMLAQLQQMTTPIYQSPYSGIVNM